MVQKLKQQKQVKIIIIVFIIIIALLSLKLFVFKDNAVYTIYVQKFDINSPDRKLIVYKDDKEIEYKEITYTNGTSLCNYEIPYVVYGDILNKDKLIVILNNNKKAEATIKNKEEIK